MTDILEAIWQRVPLALLFAGAYAMYRMLSVNGLTDSFVQRAVVRSGGRPRRLILYIIVAAAVLSSFIPNSITVLTMLPMLKALDDDFRREGVDGMTTPLMVAAVYGAGIGGMGSMIGTPANAVLLVALDVLEVPGRMQVTFLNWFVWSLPLVVMMILAAWGVAGGLGLPARVRKVRIKGHCLAAECLSPRQRVCLRMLGVFLLYWAADGIARQQLPGFAHWSAWAALGFTALLLGVAFGARPAGDGVRSGPMLRPGDFAAGIPRRGVLFLALLLAIFAVARWAGLDVRASQLASEVLGQGMAPWVFMLSSVLFVIFLTEVMSNTVVVAGFFVVIHLAAQVQAVDPLPVMVAVSVASTCAFMTPVATPANALAFGEMKGASLRAMLLLGFVLNLLGAVILSGWLGWILPIIY